MFLGVVHMFWKQINILLMWYFLSLFVFYWCFFFIFFIILIFNPMTQLECDRVGSLQVICSFFLSTCICSFLKIQNQHKSIKFNWFEPKFLSNPNQPNSKKINAQIRNTYMIYNNWNKINLQRKKKQTKKLHQKS